MVDESGKFMNLSAINFYWSPESWYYLYWWTQTTGWDDGKWYRGIELCNAVNSLPGTWYAIFSNDLRRMALYDINENTSNAVCFQFIISANQQLPPGAVLA